MKCMLPFPSKLAHLTNTEGLALGSPPPWTHIDAAAQALSLITKRPDNTNDNTNKRAHGHKTPYTAENIIMKCMQPFPC